MPTKLNRPVNYLLLLITLTATGCTENNKNTLAVNELSLDSLEKDNDYIDHYYQNYQTIDKAEIEKKAAAHKGTVWERLLSLYSLPKIENERIDREINWYLNHPNALNTIQHRAEPYLHLILDEIESKKILFAQCVFKSRRIRIMAIYTRNWSDVWIAAKRVV
jgi:membrane-bound lytic murein transglycosylase D